MNPLFSWISGTCLLLISIFLFNDDYEILLNYMDRYHGIAFHYISQPFQFLLNNLTQNINVDSYGLPGIHMVSHQKSECVQFLPGTYGCYRRWTFAQTSLHLPTRAAKTLYVKVAWCHPIS